MRKTCVAALIVLCSSIALCQSPVLAEASAPELPKAMLIEAAKPQIPVKPTHRFFDRENVALTAMTFSAALADGITTQHALAIRSTTTTVSGGYTTTTTLGYVERNPIAAPLVNRGWPGQLAATALTAGADLGLRNWAHRKGHHKIERVIPFLFAATSASFAAHNAKYW